MWVSEDIVPLISYLGVRQSSVNVQLHCSTALTLPSLKSVQDIHLVAGWMVSRAALEAVEDKNVFSLPTVLRFSDP
jgi:hypothetical protein